MALPGLIKITFEKCPECGCRDIGGIRLGNGVGMHTCGEWREFITFRCGSEYEYSPNFSKIICNDPCKKEGINEIHVDVTVRVTLQVRKTVDLSELDPKELIQVPGSDSYGCYQWQKNDVPNWRRKAEVRRVEVLKTSKIKRKSK